jgi:hypothetical protein
MEGTCASSSLLLQAEEPSASAVQASSQPPATVPSPPPAATNRANVLAWAHVADVTQLPDAVWQRVTAHIRNNFITFAFSGAPQHSNKAQGFFDVSACRGQGRLLPPGAGPALTVGCPWGPLPPLPADFNLEEKLQPKKGEHGDGDDG